MIPSYQPDTPVTSRLKRVTDDGFYGSRYEISLIIKYVYKISKLFNTVDFHCLEFGRLEFPVELNFYRSPELRCV